MSLPELKSSSSPSINGHHLFTSAITSSSAELPRITSDFHLNNNSIIRPSVNDTGGSRLSQHSGRPPLNGGGSHLNASNSGILTVGQGGITSGSSLLNNSQSRFHNSSSSAGALPPGWTLARHSVSGQKYFYNEDSKEATWNRPAYTRDKQELYQLRPEHRSLLSEQPSDKLESLPSEEGLIRPSDISHALESVAMSELELKTKLRTIGPGLYLAKLIFDKTKHWFSSWVEWTRQTINDREARYLRNVILCQACCRGWLTRGKAERYRLLLWRQSRMKVKEINKEIIQFVTVQTRKEKDWQKGDFKRWFERWRLKQYDFHFEEIIGYKRMLALEKAKRKRKKR
jgi:hypothetical protein